VRHAIARDFIAAAAVLRPHLDEQAWPAAERRRHVVHVYRMRPHRGSILSAHTHLSLAAFAQHRIPVSIHSCCLVGTRLAPCAVCQEPTGVSPTSFLADRASSMQRIPLRKGGLQEPLQKETFDLIADT